MFQRIIPFAICLFFACSLTGQDLQKVPFDINKLRNTSSARVPCALNDVGDDVIISNQPTNQTNSNFGNGETIYLCFNDSIGIDGIGVNASFGGDPNPATQPGVGFAIYDCEPTVDGPNLATLLGDNCLLGDPMSEGEVSLSVDFDEPYGPSTTFRNTIQPSTDSTFQEKFNNGEPFQWWFAPITFDVLDGIEGTWESVTLGSDQGPCISVDLDQTFSVVYLNPIEFVVNANGIDFVYPFGGNSSQARFNIAGGLPEFDVSEQYTITITNVDNPSVMGSVINGANGHRSFPEVEFPEPGTYRIDVSDGRSCGVSKTVDIDFDVNLNPVEFFIEGQETAEVGREFCVDVKTTNFDSIAGSTFIVNIDSTMDARILDGSLIDNQWQLNLSDGQIIASVFSLASEGISYPDESVLFTFCLTPNEEKECALLEFVDRSNGGTISETVDANSEIVNIPDNPANDLKVRVIDPDKVTAVISNKRDACPGVENGSFQINTLGGVPPFLVAISGAKSDGPDTISTTDDFTIFQDLPAGMYDVLIRELGTGEFTTTAVEILEANLGVTIDITSQITCNGLSNGVMSAEVSINGTAESDLSEYDFVWTNEMGDTISENESAAGLPFGTYEVFVESNNGCRQDAKSSISQPALMTVTPTSAEASCSGVEDGSIILGAVMGGNGPFTYEWSDGSTDENNTNIASGTYGYTITDDRGCELQDTFLLSASTELVIRVQNQDNVSCFGFNDGAIDISGTQQGTPVNGTYDFVWSPNATNIDNSVVQSSLVDSLAADTYTVTLTNSGLPAGCMAVQEFMISEPDTLIVETVNITNVSSCSLTNPDGAIDVTFTGGTIAGEYVYEWNDTSGMSVGNTAALTDQPSGLLSLTVTDDNGCMTTIDTAIGTPPPPEIQFFEGDNLACANDTYELTATARPGNRTGITNVLTYQWEHDASITGPSATVGPDTFLITVIDSDGCASQATAIVTSPPAIRTTEVAFKPACFATEDGEISVNAAGGSNSMGQGYDFAWSLNNDVLSTTSELTNAAPETYELRITDQSGCFIDTMINLGSLPRIVVDFPMDDISGVACFDTPIDQCNGSAVANASYEVTGGGVFTFTWGATSETIVGTNTFTSNSLCAGFQRISVTDTLGCEMIDSVMIPSPDEILLVTNVLEDVTCNGDDDGMVEIAATGGNGGFTFAWSDGSTDTDRENLRPGDYDIIILDNIGCQGQGQITIAEPEELVANIDITQTSDVTCEGDADGRITVMVTGGNPGALNYTWTNNVSNIESAAGLAPGTYLIDVVDTEGCMTQVPYTVSQPTPITADVEWAEITCNGFQTSIRVNNVMGGNPGGYTFSVDDSPARPIDETISEFGGERKISLFDAEGCRVDSIYNIEQPRALEASFVENLVEVDLGSSIDLDLEINGDLPITDIFWAQDGEQVDSSFMCAFLPCDNPTVNPLNNTVYTAFVTDANDCMAEASITVNVDKNRNVYIPNVFAPNNAGFDTNDRFAVFTGSGVSKINYAKVFNRWGTMVADLTEKQILGTNETTEIWDGFIKGEKANQGVYIYIVEIEFIDNTTLLYRGDVALLR